MVDRYNNQYICDYSGLYKVTPAGMIAWSLKESAGLSACYIDADGRTFTADYDGQLVAWNLQGERLWV